MEALLVSTVIVALAEIGDKTQLLTFVLAARYRKPWSIALGILVATLANHAAAGALGSWITATVSPDILRWVLGLSFIAMAVWVLIPDKLEITETRPLPFGVFGTTLILYFLVEIGDKTQIATVALAAQYRQLAFVVLGTTLGMLIANVPAILMANLAAHKLPTRTIRAIAAIIFAALGIAALFGGVGGVGL
jgi:Ca2+/H+ antiporter, TMEM165/GDT1 family